MKVYFISGIGADYRFFTHIRLPEGYEPSYIHWIPPRRNETLRTYALRLADQIDSSQPFILVGLSLGGIMSVEIAQRVPPVCTILISSVPLASHLPKLYRIAGKLRLGRLVPATLLKVAAMIKHSLMMRPAENRRLMRQVIRAGDDRFIRWALNAVLVWDNRTLPQPLYHIHGTRDEVFPIGRTTPTHTVRKAGHMFVVSRPETVNQFLREILPPHH
jgi:pimeloyl-ACP methyl ester carboxylesterase